MCKSLHVHGIRLYHKVWFTIFTTALFLLNALSSLPAHNAEKLTNDNSNSTEFAVAAAFIQSRCLTSFVADDLILCTDTLLRQGDLLQRWAHYEGASNYHSRAIALASENKHIERTVLGILALAQDFRYMRDFQQAEYMLNYALKVLTDKETIFAKDVDESVVNINPIGSRTKLHLQAATYALQAEIRDCLSDNVGALFTFEKAQKIRKTLRTDQPQMDNKDIDDVSNFISNTLQHIELLRHVLEQPRILSITQPGARNNVDNDINTMPTSVRTSLNVTMWHLIQTLQQRANYPKTRNERLLQLPQKALPNIPSMPVWGHSHNGTILPFVVDETDTIKKKNVTRNHRAFTNDDSLSKDKNVPDDMMDIVHQQAVRILEILRLSHNALQMEYRQLLEDNNFREDDECVSDAEAITDNGNTGRWFRFEPHRPRFDEAVDVDGCSLSSPVLCQAVCAQK